MLRLQEFLLPRPGREFPASVSLAHDYESYYRSATRGLAGLGRAGRPAQPLSAYEPATFTVVGDPLDLCGAGVSLVGDSRDELVHGDFWMMAVTAYELDSGLTRWLPQVARCFEPRPASRTTFLEVVAAEH